MGNLALYRRGGAGGGFENKFLCFITLIEIRAETKTLEELREDHIPL